MNSIVEVIVKSVYGEEKVYPANETAQTFCDIAGTKTMTHALLCKVEKLGYTINDVTPRRSFSTKVAA